MVLSHCTTLEDILTTLSPVDANPLWTQKLHYRRAKAYLGLKYYQEARLSFQKALEVQPDPAIQKELDKVDLEENKELGK